MPHQADKHEKEILDFWDKNKIFEKSVNERPQDKPYVFYDGPPFATGLPHYGHIVASLMKDVVPRYWTMRGFRVERKWGWDCHGLPIENIIEKELGLHGRQDIVDYGVDAFNKACHSAVMTYAEEWKKTISRMGRWVDMDDDYKTMDIGYMESVWWVFKQLWEKDLIYEGKKAMHICPRCATPLSNFEVTQGYKDVTDISATAKFRLNIEAVDSGASAAGSSAGSSARSSARKKFEELDGPVYALAWTTTPWTLPGNALLAVNPNIAYVLVKFFVGQGEDGEAGRAAQNNAPRYEYYLIAKDIFRAWDSNRSELAEIAKYWPPFALAGLSGAQETEILETPHIVAEFVGADLVGIDYEPLFPYFANAKNAFRIISADFVTTEEGTGIVHIAPAFGEDDYQVGLDNETEFIQHVSMDGTFTPDVTDFAGQQVKPKDNPQETDIEIIKWLAGQNKLFSKKKYKHSYPHCWRCDTPLLNYATNSWFVRVVDLRDELVKNNEDNIRWVPEHIKDKRFGLWLEGARDWAVSRNRFWGTPFPIWKSEDGDVLCVGSVAELAELTGQEITDLHKHVVDKLVITKGGKEYHRIPEVLDCWFESGSMPYGQMHYPFENKEKFERGFPAEFIAEGQDQTRGWFYTLHVLATALTRGKDKSIPAKSTAPAFRNVIVNGIVLAEDGKKMSKRLQNYPDPTEVLEKYGADAMRYYLATSPVMHAESLNFSESGVREVFNKLINTLWNVLTFYEMFAREAGGVAPLAKPSTHVLDRWIMARLGQLVNEVGNNMENYELAAASRPIVDFVSDLSQWYVRRSRDRFKGDNAADAAAALATLHDTLALLARVMAPFTPFLAETIHLSVKKFSGNGANRSAEYAESVHLELWPEKQEKIDVKILLDMHLTRAITNMIHSKRKESSVRARQVLQNAEIQFLDKDLEEDFLELVKGETNIKEVLIVKKVSLPDANRVMFSDESGKTKVLCEVALNTKITDELKKEGLVRELIRAINELRKGAGLAMGDHGALTWNSDNAIVAEVFAEYGDEIARATHSARIEQADGGAPAEIPDVNVLLKVEKA